jgi:hypothetical protein
VPDNTFDDRLSLQDLDGVRVTVEGSLPRGITAEALKHAVETQLAAGKVRILSLGEFPTGDPHVRLTVSTSRERGGFAAASVQLDFVQIVFMRRNPAVTFNHGQTWRADAQVVLAPVAGIARDVQREVARQVDQFIRDYRAVNA